MQKNHRILKLACYSTNVSMSIISNIPPILFLTFREKFGITYSLLGLLVLINFFTQLVVDLLFSFFSHKFNIPKAVKFTPVLCVLGLIFYALCPLFMKGNEYIGLAIGTIIFSASSGFGEVLISPVIAAIPAKDPDREMSKLHSIYAWGVVGAVTVATVFLTFVGSEYWQILMLILAIVPLFSAIMFRFSEIPKMDTPERVSGVLEYLKNPGVWACFIAIFLGGAAECTMAQWCSGYVEQSLGIPKIFGDVFGVALFGATLGLGRTLYSKIGKNIAPVLFFGALGATLCYLVAAISPFAIVGLLACAITGFCVSMLWPGSLIVGSDRFPTGGVFIFAMMAAGGDLGASVGPQLVGIITDFAIANPFLTELAQNLSIMPSQLGMKLGMLIGMLFPLAAVPLYFFIWKKHYKKKKS